MRINEVLNSKNYITEEDTMTLADVQVMYGDDPVMMAAITRAKMLPKIQINEYPMSAYTWGSGPPYSA